MHDWDNAGCSKILKNCKKAITPRDAGGKVIILDMVMGGQSSNIKHKDTVLFDLFIMFVNGVKRDEQEWKKIIYEAGFSDYKIIPVLGVFFLTKLDLFLVFDPSLRSTRNCLVKTCFKISF